MQIPNKLTSYPWAKSRTLCVALFLLELANWPKGKTCRTSVLDLAGKLGWSWRAVNKDIKILEDSGFITTKSILEKGIKKLDISIKTAY